MPPPLPSHSPAGSGGPGVLGVLRAHANAIAERDLATTEVLSAVRWAASPHLDPELYQQLARDGRKQVTRKLAENPDAPPAALQVLARHPDRVTATYAAHHPQLPYPAAADALRRLGRAEHESPNCPADIVNATYHRSPADAVEVASHPHLDASVIATGVRDGSERLVRGLLRHPGATQDDFTVAQQRFHWVPTSTPWSTWAAHRAATTPWLDNALGHAWGSNQGTLVVAAVAGHQSASPAALHRIATLSGRAALALANPATPESTLTHVAERNAGQRGFVPNTLRLAITENASAGVATLAHLTAADVGDPLTVVTAHARTGVQALVMLHLLPSWERPLDELVLAAAGACA